MRTLAVFFQHFVCHSIKYNKSNELGSICRVVTRAASLLSHHCGAVLLRDARQLGASGFWLESIAIDSAERWKDAMSALLD